MTTLTRRRAGLVSAAAVAAGFLVVAVAAPALSASTDAPSTTIRKSVQTLMDPDGTVQATRIYTQIQSTGNGQVQFTDSTSGSLRNLNGFGTPAVSDNTASFDFSVNGLKNQRTLQDFVKGDLPIKVKVEATLDGQPLSPNDVVGKSGLLKMTYTITNDTSVDQEITWKDGTGATQTKTVGIPIPYVGSLTTVLSDSYADIVAPGASMGGTGRNSTQLSYNLLLYKPLGDTTATVTYEAQITNADIPSVDMTFLPAGPAENPSTKSLQEQIKGGADSGTQITDAGTQIDQNLLKLAAGAGQLNAGLAQLQSGATQLSAGLNDTAVPGAKKLADGASQVSTGSSTLDSGLADLNDGIALLYAGVDALPASVNKQLASNPDYQTLIGTLSTIISGIGTPTSVPVTPTTPLADRTLMGGLLGIKYGLRTPYTYAGSDCAVALVGGTPVKCGAMDAVQTVSELLVSPTTVGQLNGLAAGINTTASTYCAGNPVCLGTFAELAKCINGASTCNPGTGATATIKVQTATASGALAATYGQVDTSLIPGITSLRTSLYNKADNTCNKKQTDPTKSDYCGMSQALQAILAGVPVLVNQITGGISAELKANIGQPTSGCDPKATLACGAAALSGGAGQLSGGASQVADGANQLSTGLAPAAAGATQIADGLTQAVPGGTQIEDGANQLSAQGSKLLIAKGNETTNSYGEQYATMEALNARSATQAGIPNGPAKGQDVVTTGAFGYTLQGVSQADSTNALRFLLAGLLLAGAVGVGVAFSRT
jgi:putative membrane protein